jgi:murein DD-endopeptidase / murein LD-carboxypeptidase
MPDAQHRGHPRQAAIVAGARACIGARFRPQGRCAAGYDCLGVVFAAARHAGIAIADWGDYDWRLIPATQVWQALQVRGCVRVAADHAAPGDIAWIGSATRQHALILTATGVIEADSRERRIVERAHRDLPSGTIYLRLPQGAA